MQISKMQQVTAAQSLLKVIQSESVASYQTYLPLSMLLADKLCS